MATSHNIRNYEIIWYDDEAGYLRRRRKNLNIRYDTDQLVATGVVDGCVRNNGFPSDTDMADILRGMWGGEHGYWYKEVL